MAFPHFQDSDYIFLAEEDIMQHKWLKKANRLFLQALADLPDLWSWSHLLRGRRGHGASELRIFRFARWLTNPHALQTKPSILARREGSLPTDPQQAGCREQDSFARSSGNSGGQRLTAATTGTLGAEGSLPSGTFCASALATYDRQEDLTIAAESFSSYNSFWK